MKRLGVYLSTVLIALAVSPAAAHASRGAENSTCANCGGDPGTSVGAGTGGIDVGENDGGSWSGDPGSPGVPAGSNNGPVYEYDYVPACGANRTLSAINGFSSTVDCPGAHKCPDPTQVEMYIARRQITGTTRGPWTFAGSACLGAEQMLAYDPAAAAAFALDYFRHLPLPDPGVHVQPAGRTLVNLPTIVYADPAPAGRWTVDHAPFPTITITGTPHWSVDFDGSTVDSDSPGRAYDGTDPRGAPGYYLAHTYTAPTGSTPITVTVTWSATFTLGDNPTAIPMTGTVTRSSTTTVAVDEAAAVLTGNT